VAPAVLAVAAPILVVAVLHQVAALAFRALQDKDITVAEVLMVVVVVRAVAAEPVHKAQMLLLHLSLQAQTEG
jgi:uncharacterized membrane protein YhaH (DUF805 family)